MNEILKLLILLMVISDPCYSQFNTNGNRYYLPQVRFKDGTILKNVSIRFEGSDSPSSKGVILHSTNDRVYFHHYPYRPPVPIFKDFVPDDGTYRTNRVIVGHKHIEHYKPPIKMSDFNPVHIPQCVPSRIPFIHFDKPTLNELHKTLQPLSKGTTGAHWANKDAIRFITKAAWHKPRPFEMNTLKESRYWQGEVEAEMRLSWLKIYYGRWLERK